MMTKLRGQRDTSQYGLASGLLNAQNALGGNF